jgi:hypothetical protein
MSWSEDAACKAQVCSSVGRPEAATFGLARHIANRARGSSCSAAVGPEGGAQREEPGADKSSPASRHKESSPCAAPVWPEGRPGGERPEGTQSLILVVL